MIPESDTSDWELLEDRDSDHPTLQVTPGRTPANPYGDVTDKHTVRTHPSSRRG